MTQRRKIGDLGIASERAQTYMDPDRWDTYCFLCCDGGDSLILCEGRCLRVFHRECLPDRDKKRYSKCAWRSKFKCSDCVKQKQLCFICGKYGNEKVKLVWGKRGQKTGINRQHGPGLHQCPRKCCGKFYHSACLDVWPASHWQCIWDPSTLAQNSQQTRGAGASHLPVAERITKESKHHPKSEITPAPHVIGIDPEGQEKVQPLQAKDLPPSAEQGFANAGIPVADPDLAQRMLTTNSSVALGQRKCIANNVHIGFVENLLVEEPLPADTQTSTMAQLVVAVPECCPYHYCAVCGHGGSVVHCLKCPKGFHRGCMPKNTAFFGGQSSSCLCPQHPQIRKELELEGLLPRIITVVPTAGERAQGTIVASVRIALIHLYKQIFVNQAADDPAEIEHAVDRGFSVAALRLTCDSTVNSTGNVIRYDQEKDIIGGVTFMIYKQASLAEIVFVASSWDSQGMGFGAYLFQMTTGLLSSMGIKRVCAYADLDALSFFTKQGFRQVPKTSPIDNLVKKHRHSRPPSFSKLMQRLVAVDGVPGMTAHAVSSVKSRPSRKRKKLES